MQGLPRVWRSRTRQDPAASGLWRGHLEERVLRRRALVSTLDGRSCHFPTGKRRSGRPSAIELRRRFGWAGALLTIGVLLFPQPARAGNVAVESGPTGGVVLTFAAGE